MTTDVAFRFKSLQEEEDVDATLIYDHDEPDSTIGVSGEGPGEEPEGGEPKEEEPVAGQKRKLGDDVSIRLVLILAHVQALELLD